MLNDPYVKFFARGLIFWLLVSAAGFLWGEKLVRSFIPLYETVIESISDGWKTEITIIDTAKGRSLNMAATTVKPIPVIPQVDLPPGKTIEVQATLLHQLVPMVILLTIILAWPAKNWQHRLYMLLFFFPALLIVAATTTPMQFLGTLEISFQNYAASLGYQRAQPPVLYWMILTEGGARWLIPALLGLGACSFAQWVVSKQARGA